MVGSWWRLAIDGSWWRQRQRRVWGRIGERCGPEAGGEYDRVSCNTRGPMPSAIRVFSARALPGDGVSRSCLVWGSHPQSIPPSRRISQVVDTIEFVYQSQSLTLQDRASFFHDTLQSYGRTALILSGGSALGMCGPWAVGRPTSAGSYRAFEDHSVPAAFGRRPGGGGADSGTVVSLTHTPRRLPQQGTPHAAVRGRGRPPPKGQHHEALRSLKPPRPPGAGVAILSWAAPFESPRVRRNVKHRCRWRVGGRQRQRL